MRVNLFFSLPILILLTSCNYEKELTASHIVLSPVYSSGMILQTSPSTVISGKADAGGILAVKINDYKSLVQANEKGNWRVQFPEITLTEPFSIGIEGKDSSIILKNVQAGKVFVIAGDGNFPVLPELHAQRSFNQSSENLMIFRPPFKGSSHPLQLYSGGKWQTIEEPGNSNKISWFLSHIQQSMDENNVPVGIIDLSWPGTKIESWLPVDGNLQLNSQIIESSFIDSCFALNTSNLTQILAMKDTCREGIKKGVTRVWYNDETWRKTEFPVIMGGKDDIRKKRIVYLRKKIYVPEKHLNSNFHINLGHLHGHANYYFNEKEIHPQIVTQEKTQLIIPDSLMRVWTNILTIRLFCTDSLAGYYGNEFICHNADSSYYRAINTDWKYSFNLESEFPELIPLEQIPGIAYNSLLSPLLKISAESILFQFRNTTLHQSSDFSKKACEFLNTLPDSWNMSLANQELTYTDTIIHGVESTKIDSIYREITSSCDIGITGK